MADSAAVRILRQYVRGDVESYRLSYHLPGVGDPDAWISMWQDDSPATFKLHQRARAALGMKPLVVRSCRKCGCTAARACSGGCAWVERDLCSACADPKKKARRN